MQQSCTILHIFSFSAHPPKPCTPLSTLAHSLGQSTSLLHLVCGYSDPPMHRGTEMHILQHAKLHQHTTAAESLEEKKHLYQGNNIRALQMMAQHYCCTVYQCAKAVGRCCESLCVTMVSSFSHCASSFSLLCFSCSCVGVHGCALVCRCTGVH